MGRFVKNCNLFGLRELVSYIDFNFKISSSQTTGDDDPEIRYLSADCGIQPRKSNNYGVPSDIIDVFKASSEEGSNTLNDFLANRLSNVRNFFFN